MLTNLIQFVGSRSLEIMERIGYWGLFLLSILDRVLLSLVPSEVILPFAGFLIGEGRFSWLPVLLWVTVGNLGGDLVVYWISAKGGRWLLEKYGKYFFITKHDLDHTDKLFAKHGGKLVIIGRLLPIVRTFVAIPAGIVRMPLTRFIWYTVIGSLPYNVLWIYIGYKSGQNWEALKPIFDKAEWFIGGALLIAIVWYIYRHINKKHVTH
ncbi:MAG: DedA family protein [bacterium]|nr:DedA family protein [bacterium]